MGSGFVYNNLFGVIFGTNMLQDLAFDVVQMRGISPKSVVLVGSCGVKGGVKGGGDGFVHTHGPILLSGSVSLEI